VNEARLLPVDAIAPTELRTPEALLRPQRLEDAEADYEAVMASRAALRVWCDGAWPEDGFTLDQNRDDLAGHIEDAEAGVAYGYTIWEPGGARVLGSLYLAATAPFLDAYLAEEGERAAIAGCDVRVECWLRSDLPTDFEARLLADVRDWLACAWPFLRPCWGSRRGMHARRALLEEMGMVEVAALTSRDGTRRFHLHADGAAGAPSPT
jgi:hypothetical protein